MKDQRFIVLFLVCILFVWSVIQYIMPLLRYNKIPQLTYNNINPLLESLRLYRTSESRVVTSKAYKNCYQKWLELNPNICIEWFNNRDCLKFMQTQGDVLLQTYQALRPGAFKADLFRLCILYERGGIYVDDQTTPHVSIKKMLAGIKLNKPRFISVLDAKVAGGGRIHNGIIIAEPQHPFLKACIDRIVSIVNKRSYEDYTLAVTGPFCFGRAINSYLGRPEAAHFHVGHNEYGNNSFYLYRHSWGPFQNIYKGQELIMSKKHCFLSYLIAKSNPINYGNMYKNKKLYLN